MVILDNLLCYADESKVAVLYKGVFYCLDFEFEIIYGTIQIKFSSNEETHKIRDIADIRIWAETECHTDLKVWGSDIYQAPMDKIGSYDLEIVKELGEEKSSYIIKTITKIDDIVVISIKDREEKRSE